MQNYMVSILLGILTYFIVRLLIPASEKEIVNGRVSKYFNQVSIEDVADQVMQERHPISKKRADLSQRLISRDFAEYVCSSGVKLTASEYLTIWVGVTFIPAILFALAGIDIVTVFAAAIAGLLIPPAFLVRARKKRQDLFTAQLGESLIVMGNAIKGGFSFAQAMESVSTEMQPPISLEFGKCIREIQYGITQEEALLNMGERIKNEDLHLLVSAVLTSAQVGGNLSDIMDTIATTIKDRIRIKQEVRVLTSTGRISALIIALLPVFLVLILMFINPSYFGLFFDSQIGKAMIIVAVLLEITGFMFIRKISDIEY